MVVYRDKDQDLVPFLLLGMQVLLVVLGLSIRMGLSLDLGYGGLPGQRSARTGGVWPPYPGANQGYWARQAGFYDNLPAFSKPKSLRIPAVINQSTSTLTPSIFSTNLTTQLPTPKTRPHNNSPFSLPTLFRPIQVLL